MSFELEGDLRAWVRKQLGPVIRWIEPSRGSTDGLPDCWFHLPLPGQLPMTVWVELKIGELDRDGSMIRFKMRPAQKRVIEEMVDEGGLVFLLVGEKGGDRVWLFHPDLAQADGWIDLELMVTEGKCWGMDLSPWAFPTLIRMAVQSIKVPKEGPQSKKIGGK